MCFHTSYGATPEDFDGIIMNEQLTNNSYSSLKYSLLAWSELLGLFTVTVLVCIAAAHRMFLENLDIYRNRIFVATLVVFLILAFLAFLNQLIWTITHLVNNRYLRFFFATSVDLGMILMIIFAFWIDSPTLLYAS